MSGLESAVWSFAWERFRGLARDVAIELANSDATGMFGDDAVDNAERPSKTLWDEFRYEREFGPHDALESAWKQTIWPFLEAAIATVSIVEQRLLGLGTDEDFGYDPEDEEPPPIVPDALIRKLYSTLKGLALDRHSSVFVQVLRKRVAIGKELSSLRNRLQLSERELGEALGLTVSQIRDFEQDRSVTPRIVGLAAEGLEHCLMCEAKDSDGDGDGEDDDQFS